jgi:hypothetical protein
VFDHVSVGVTLTDGSGAASVFIDDVVVADHFIGCS